jgi:RNA polymerase sigma-70 factor (ECF subfamily)
MTFEDELSFHTERLFRFGMKLTHDSEEVKDLIQDTMVLALKYRDKFDGSNLGAWLVTIFKNHFYNVKRRQSVKRRVLERFEKDSTLSFTPFSFPAPDSSLAESDLKKLMSELPDEFRKVVELVDFKGFTYEETSKISSCPKGTVMSRLHRGRNLLLQENP